MHKTYFDHINSPLLLLILQYLPPNSLQTSHPLFLNTSPIVFHICIDMRVSHKSMINLPGTTSLDKTDSPSTGSQQLLASQMRKDKLVSSSPLYAGMLTETLLNSSCGGHQSCCELMSTVVLLDLWLLKKSLWLPLKQCSINLMGYNIAVPFQAKHSTVPYSLHFGQ